MYALTCKKINLFFDPICSMHLCRVRKGFKKFETFLHQYQKVEDIETVMEEILWQP